jgi:stage II sporulation protein D
MKRAAASALIASALVLLVSHAAAQDLQVDLFTRSGAKEVVISPGISAVEICSTPSRGPCTTISDNLRCKAEAGAVRCHDKAASRLVKRLTARSSSVFRLEVWPQESGRASAPRSLMARSAGIRVAGGSLRAVATMDLETYVSGVLAGEAATFRSPAAMEAMAVVARTWALASRGRHRADGYDFCSLTHCQFFRPPLAPDGNAALTEAANRTASLVLKFHGKLIDAYYSAHCGGQTASAASVWPDRAAPYLVSVADPICARDGRAWEQAIAWADITRVFKEDILPGFRGPLRDLLIERNDASGRALTLRLAGDSAQVIDAHAFRYAINRRLGWNTLKSSMFTIQRGNDGLTFRGRGLGHGVGLCQTGADAMGQSGASVDRILAHYFPGATIEPAEDQRARVLSSEHFELSFPAREETLVSRALEILESERAKLGARARGLSPRVAVRTYGSTADFGRATGQPGWVAGASDGRSIDLQPLHVLESHGILRRTLRHELLHLVVHRSRARGVPRWYEEGMILYLAEESMTALPAVAVEKSMAAARTRMEQSYARARSRVAALARQRGEDVLWEVLQNPSPEDLQWFMEADVNR